MASLPRRKCILLRYVDRLDVVHDRLNRSKQLYNKLAQCASPPPNVISSINGSAVLTSLPLTKRFLAFNALHMYVKS